MANKNDYTPYILPVGLLAIVFLGGKAILTALGIITPGEQQQDIKMLSAANYFDPDFYKSGGAGTKILTVGSAEKLAKLIRDAKGIFNDDESQVYGVFEQLRYQSQVSFLSAIFFKMYNVSLYGYLREFLNDAEIARIASICNKLPKYR